MPAVLGWIFVLVFSFCEARNAMFSHTINPGQIVTILPDAPGQDFPELYGLKITSDGVVYTTQHFHIPEDIKTLPSSIQYKDSRGKLTSHNLVKDLAEMTTQRLLVHGPYSGYVCGTSQTGSAVQGLDVLYRDLRNIPSNTKVIILKGDEDKFYIDDDILESGRTFEIGTTKQLANNARSKFQTVIQVTSGSSTVERGFLNVEVQKCATSVDKAKSGPLQSTRATRPDLIQVVNSRMTGDLFS